MGFLDELKRLTHPYEDDMEDDYDEDEDLYEDEDEDDTVFYSVECPGCGFKLTVDEDTLDAGSFECPECGEVIDFENAAVEEVVFDDEDDEDEKD